jgi:hypothetical protein
MDLYDPLSTALVRVGQGARTGGVLGPQLGNLEAGQADQALNLPVEAH